MWNVAVERQIQVIGPDAEAFVNYVITRDATRIEPMRAKYVILCNQSGGVLNDPVYHDLIRQGDNSIADDDLALKEKSEETIIKLEVLGDGSETE